MSFIAMEPHFRCNPDCFDYERNARPSEAVRPWPDQTFPHSVQNKSYIGQKTINTIVLIE